MSCSSDARELLTFWAAGTLGPEEADRVTRHLEACDDCRAAAAEGAGLIAGLRDLHLRSDEIVAAAAGDLHSPHVQVCPQCRDEIDLLRAVNADLAAAAGKASGTASKTVWAVAAAAVILTLPLAWYLRTRQATAPIAPVTTVVTAPAAPKPLRIVVAKPSLSRLADEDVQVRGVADARRRMLADLAVALEPYRHDDFAECATRLRAVRGRYPGAPEITYYLGICLLMLDRPMEAQTELEQVAGRALPADEVAYYLAVARINAGHVAAGVAELTRLCGSRAEVSSRACAAAAQASSSR